MSSRLRVDPSGAADAPPAEGLAWFLALLQQAMTETMAGEGTPLQKASAIARLGNLYLKAHHTTELAKENKALRWQVTALEERLAAAEALLATRAGRDGLAAGLEDDGVSNVAAALDHQATASGPADSLGSGVRQEPGSRESLADPAPILSGQATLQRSLQERETVRSEALTGALPGHHGD